MSTERALTVEEFERIAPFLDGRSELIDGRLRVISPTGLLHGILAARIVAALACYLDEHPARGEAVGAETGFCVNDPHRPVLAPDAAFIRMERLPAESTGRDDPRTHFMDGPPDLAVEIRSPDDSMPEMLEQAHLWLAVGAHEVWLIDGQHETIQILRTNGEPIRLEKADLLTSPAVLPGFTLSLARLFARRRRAAPESHQACQVTAATVAEAGTVSCIVAPARTTSSS